MNYIYFFKFNTKLLKSFSRIIKFNILNFPTLRIEKNVWETNISKLHNIEPHIKSWQNSYNSCKQYEVKLCWALEIDPKKFSKKVYRDLRLKILTLF